MIWILAVLAVLFLSVISIYNQMIHAQMKVEEARSGIDAALSKRYSILTNMQESIKGYVKHEKEVLVKLAQIHSSMSIKEVDEINQQYAQTQQKLIALAENYPDLKASTLFHDFNEAIVDCEEHLQAARRFYNSNVTLYNEKILMFPGSIFASLMHKEKAEFFEAEASEKENVDASF